MLKYIIILILAICSTNVFAQYVKTDELVFLPGYEEPITLEEYNQKQDSIKELNKGYLGKFQIPGNGGHIISQFGPRSGRMHYGTDIKMEKGDTIVAAQSGTVIRSGWGYGYGNLIIISHENEIETYYAHLSQFLVESGTWVAQGEPIGLAGSTGRARGNHLHFEMRESGRAFDPELVFDFSKQEIRKEAVEMESLTALHKKLKPQGYSNNVPVPEYYKVRSGDTLSAISRRFKTSVNAICQLNNISETSVLQIGQPLRMF